MIGDPCQDGTEIKRGIKPAEFGGADEGVERSCALTAGIGTEEQVVFSSNRDRPQRPLGSAVIDLQQTVIDVARERTPVGQCIADRNGGVALGRQRPDHPSPSTDGDHRGSV